MNELKEDRDLNNVSSIYKKIVVLLIIVELIIITIFFFYFLSKSKKMQIHVPDKQDNRTYSIFIVGENENYEILRKVYKGARRVCSAYDSIADFFVSELVANNPTLQPLLDFSSNASADGIIAYIPNDVFSLNEPVTTDGKWIPLVTIGNDSPNISKIFNFSKNCSEFGEKIGKEAVGIFTKESSVLVLNYDSASDEKLKTVERFALYELRKHKITNYKIIDNSKNSYDVILDNFIVNEKENGRKILIICISENDTVNAVKTTSEFDYFENTQIVGCGETSQIYYYFEKGQISSLITFDYEKIGELSMEQIFNYKTKGYVDDIKIEPIVLKSGKR